MYEEATELARRGMHVEVFTTDAYEADRRIEAPRYRVEDGVVVHRFPNLSNRLAFEKYRFTPRGLVSGLRSIETDAIHLSEVRHELALATFHAASRRDIPLVVSAHGTLPLRDGWKATLRRAYDRAFVGPMLRRSVALLGQTSHECDLYRRFGVDDAKIRLLPLGVGAPPPAGDNLELGPPPGVPFVLFLGRIHELKGVDRLVDGFARSRAASYHHLVIAGRDDGALAGVEARVDGLGLRDRVHFPGPIYGDARFDAYRQAALFAITPTHFEETSLASLEAASVGTPLLVSEEADLPFLVEYDAGRVVPAGADVTPALDEMLGHDLAAMGAAAKRMIDERHLWPVVAATFEQIMQESV